MLSLSLLNVWNPDDAQKLHRISQSVGAEDRDRVCQLIDPMWALMHNSQGIGLAAPQVDHFWRLIMMDVPDLRTSAPAPYQTHWKGVMINPVLVEKSLETVASEEGCLSVPEFGGTVQRHRRVCVAYQTAESLTQGTTLTVYLAELAAVCVQHEIDHLDGKLFIDQLTEPKEREALLKRMQEVSRVQAS